MIESSIENLFTEINNSNEYKEYINDNSTKNLLEFAFFRTKLSNYLFSKAEEISQRLLKI